MYNISLLEGNGSALFGGGSIQREYDIWAQNKDNEINLNHLVNCWEDEYYQELTLFGRTIHNVVSFNPLLDGRLINDLELFKKNVFNNLIVLTFPFGDTLNTKEEEQVEFYSKLFRLHKDIYKEDSNIIVVCYDYKKDVVLANLGARYPKLFKDVDKIWVNNENNPLVEHLIENEVDYSKFYFKCPQFIADEKFEDISKGWYDKDKKNMSQLYFVGRNLDWKGWREIEDLPVLLSKNNLDMNLDFNGFVLGDNLPELDNAQLSKVIYNDTDLYTEKFRTKVNKHFKCNRYFKGFTRKENKELSKEAGFIVYFTNLDPDNNFFPEYAVIDAVKAGSVMIIPDWYFFHTFNKRFFKSVFPSSVLKVNSGMLTFDPDNKENSAKQLAINIRILQKDFNLYEKFRRKQLELLLYMYGANKTILPLLK